MNDRTPPTPGLPPFESRALTQANHSLTIKTDGQGFVEITPVLLDWLRSIGAGQGLLTVFIAHTSASLTIQENADPSVLRDLADSLARLAPKVANYRHTSEGPDDMPAHIKTMLTSVSLSIPVIDGRTALGTWQGVYVIEHRTRQHARKVELHFIGTCHTSAL
jgi:secondary thiamine-phosphate synthase enzyme